MSLLVTHSDIWLFLVNSVHIARQRILRLHVLNVASKDELTDSVSRTFSQNILSTCTAETLGTITTVQ